MLNKHTAVPLHVFVKNMLAYICMYDRRTHAHMHVWIVCTRFIFNLPYIIYILVTFHMAHDYVDMPVGIIFKRHYI